MSRRVVVVGGGVVGCCAAYYLRRTGAEVTVIDAATVGSGASWGNAGWVVPTFSAPLPAPGMAMIALRSLARPNGSFYVSARHVPRMARWLWRFWRCSSAAVHAAGLHATAKFALPTHGLFEELAADGVRVEMSRRDLMYVFLHQEKAENARRALAPLAEHGYPAPTQVDDGRALRETEPALSPAVRAGFVVPGERTVYPPSLMAGLHSRLLDMGVTIREHHPVSGFVAEPGAVTAVRAGGGTIDADDVVLAAGAWTTALAAQLGVHVPMEPGKGYSFMVTPGRMPAHSLYLAEAKVGVTPFEEGLRLAGTMELSGMSPELNRSRVSAVARSAQEYLVAWEPGSLRHEWVGMRPMTPDGLPVIGRASGWRNVYLATGHAMLGVTLGPATGLALAQLIAGGADTEMLRPFSPDRFAAARRPARLRGA